MNITDLIKQIQQLDKDHEPDGWPAIRMKDLTILADEIVSLSDKVEKLNKALDAAMDTGVYPKQVIGGPKPYKKRTKWMEGWNACQIVVIKRISKSLGKDV